MIISNGDIGYHGRKLEDRLAVTGTNHGSIEQIGGQYYIFYHRSTHNSLSSRQGCAEPIVIESDGTIKQVEMTSCGLNGGPLAATGIYPAAIACNLTNGKAHHLSATEENPDIANITHDAKDRFIGGIETGTCIGFKYFEFTGNEKLKVTTRGTGQGKIFVSAQMDGEPAAEIAVKASEDWTDSESAGLTGLEGKQALFLKYVGEQTISLLKIEFC